MGEKHERMRCAKCGKIVAARQPKLGDGSVLLPYRHKALDGDRGSICIGSFQDAIVVLDRLKGDPADKTTRRQEEQ